MIQKLTIPDQRVMGGYGEIGGKRIKAKWTSGRALFLVSHFAVKHGYLLDVLWAVYDYGSAVLVGAGNTKAEAIDTARRILQKNRLGLRNEFIKGRAKLNAHRAYIEAEIQRFEEFKAKQSSVTNVPAKRRRVFAQSGGKCHYCSVALTLTGEWQMDHYIARSKGGPDHLSNLVAACTPCNQRKGNLNGDEFKAHLKLMAEHGPKLEEAV